MADQDGKCIPPPYKCNWCAEELHGRHGRGLFKSSEVVGVYCTKHCIDQAKSFEYAHQQFIKDAE